MPTEPKKRTELVELNEIHTMRAQAMNAANNAARAIDSPWCVSYYLVCQAILQFKVLTGRVPKRIHIPVMIEAALQVYMARELDEHDKLRLRADFMNMPVVWDAREFKIE